MKKKKKKDGKRLKEIANGHIMEKVKTLGMKGFFWEYCSKYFFPVL